MIREIKFKIWYPSSNIMDGPFDIDLFYIRNSAHPRFSESGSHFYLQYAGLKDINGIKIYEGDIVEFMIDDIILHREIKWLDDEIRFDFYPFVLKSDCYNTYYSFSDFKN